MIPLTDGGELDLEALDGLAAEGHVKVVATDLVSNALGTVNPVERLSAWAHDQGAIMVVDAAQGAPIARSTSRLSAATSSPSRRTSCVARAGSAPCGASGAAGGDGAVQPRRPHDQEGSVRGDLLDELPHKFEAGTSPIAEAVGFGAAVDYLNAIGLDAIEQLRARAGRVRARAAERRAGNPAVRPSPERRAGIVSFNMDGVHPHDVAQVLDWEGVAIGAGTTAASR